MNQAIAREVLTMKRRGITPAAIMRAWRITPDQYAKVIADTELVRDVDAHMRRERMPEPTGRSPTAGY
jgi:hypothetical protein